ncbi:helix-turn-helix domain-containing protein [Kitasatospora sp. NPDC085895]|uniref:helix-turn-helix domain-containing protein n=1 Tax=Kitasatospora sp. NPDC085895 TaxID=3155057 RepID=UPI003450E7C5
MTRFPASVLARRSRTGDYIRVLATVADYARATGVCFASDRTIADKLGLSRGGVNRLLGKAEQDGLLASEFNAKRGTMDRRIRPFPADALAVCVSTHALAKIPGSRFKVYAFLSLRQHLGEETPVRLVAERCALSVETARAGVAELLAEGWISREGDTGRACRYTVHPQPLRGVATQSALFPQPRQSAQNTGSQAQEQPDRDTDDDVGVAVCEGQIALFDAEDTGSTPLGSVTGSPLDSVTATPLVPVTQTRSLEHDLLNRRSTEGGCGSGEAATSVPREALAGSQPVDAVAAGAPSRPAASPDPRKTAPAPEHSTLPPLTVSAEIHQVLRLVPDLVARMSRWQQREAARAIGRAIREVDGDVQRVADRLLRRAALDAPQEVRDPYAWLVHRGVKRRGCHLAGCESGTDLVLGGLCTTCAYHLEGAQHRHALRRESRRRPGADAAHVAAGLENRGGRTSAACESTKAGGGPYPDNAAALRPPRAAPVPVTARDDPADGIALREMLAARRRAREAAA